MISVTQEKNNTSVVNDVQIIIKLLWLKFTINDLSITSVFII